MKNSSVLDCIYDRRSIRSFKQEMPETQLLEKLVDAAFESPSAKNGQPWHITVCRNQALNDNVVEACKIYHKANGSFTEQMQDFHNFYHAPVVIYLSAELENMRFAANDIGVMEQTIALAAHELGLGTCIIWNALPAFKSEKRDELLKKLQIPAGYEPYATLALGYIEGEMPEAKPRDKSKINWIS